MALSPLYYTSSRGQCAVLLLAALHDLFVNDSRRNVAKREAIGHIAARHWFAFEDEDREPYPSQLWLSGEPRWQTLIAWARKDFVLRDLVSYEARDAWGLTRHGRDSFERFHHLCQIGRRPVEPCFLWSVQFKQYMCPNHLPAATDAKRPSSFYSDMSATISFEGI